MTGTIASTLIYRFEDRDGVALSRLSLSISPIDSPLTHSVCVRDSLEIIWNQTTAKLAYWLALLFDLPFCAHERAVLLSLAQTNLTMMFELRRWDSIAEAGSKWAKDRGTLCCSDINLFRLCCMEGEVWSKLPERAVNYRAQHSFQGLASIPYQGAALFHEGVHIWLRGTDIQSLSKRSKIATAHHIAIQKESYHEIVFCYLSRWRRQKIIYLCRYHLVDQVPFRD